MKSFTCLLATAVIAALALGQTTTAPGQPGVRADAKPKATANAERHRKPKRDIRLILNSRVPEVRFEQVPLEKVMEWVQEYTGAMVYVRYAVLEEHDINRETLITVKARDAKLEQILWVIMNEAAGSTGVTLAYEASADLFLFSTHDDLSSKMVTRIYDVRNIIVDVPYFSLGGALMPMPTAEGSEGVVWRTRVRRPPPSPSLGSEVISDTQQPPRREITTEDEALHEFMEFILNTVEPESWEVNSMGGKGTIFPYKGKLIIRNSLHVHQLIAGAANP